MSRPKNVEALIVKVISSGGAALAGRFSQETVICGSEVRPLTIPSRPAMPPYP